MSEGPQASWALLCLPAFVCIVPSAGCPSWDCVCSACHLLRRPERWSFPLLCVPVGQGPYAPTRTSPLRVIPFPNMKTNSNQPEERTEIYVCGEVRGRDLTVPRAGSVAALTGARKLCNSYTFSAATWSLTCSPLPIVLFPEKCPLPPSLHETPDQPATHQSL